MAIEQMRASCPECGKKVLAQREKLDGAWVLFWISILLLGVLLPVWAEVYIWRDRHRAPWVCPICGKDVVPDGWGRKYLGYDGGWSRYKYTRPTGRKEKYSVPGRPRNTSAFGAKAAGGMMGMTEIANALPRPPKTIQIKCECGKTLKFPASAEGARGKCPACGRVAEIPARTV